MTQIWDCTDARLSLGVYVLGAIDPAERSLVDAHLVTCRDCRDELAGLAGLPALLARVNPDEISRICADDTVRAGTYAGADDRPPEELIGTVLDLAEARRRRTRWRFLAAAAAVVAIAGGLFGGLSSITTTRTVPVPVSLPGTHWETVEATGSGGVSASVAYYARTVGRRVPGPGGPHPGRDHLPAVGRPPRRDADSGGSLDDGQGRGQRLVLRLDGGLLAADQQIPDHRGPQGLADSRADLNREWMTPPGRCLFA